MEDRMPVVKLGVSLRREHPRNYIEYLECNREEVVDFCENLCGLNPDKAEKAYRQLLDDAREDERGADSFRKYKGERGKGGMRTRFLRID
ncbi:MAG: hypothetical protein V1889_01145 [archaeon]